jgi:cullin 1
LGTTHAAHCCGEFYSIEYIIEDFCKTIDQGLVKKVMDPFVSLGIDEGDLNKAPLDNYKEHFEIPLLSATEAYYKHESDSILIENSVSDYLKKAEERLKGEEDRVRYLHTTARKLLITKCEHFLVHAHAELMWENPEGLEPLRRKSKNT